MAFLYPDIISPGVNLPIVTPSSPEGIERRKWELPKSMGGYNRDGFQEYPKSLFKAGRPKANVEITESLTVRSEEEERLALGQGWAKSADAAIQLVHDTHTEHAKLAANRAYHDQRMTDVARREAEAREAAIETVHHVPELPELPKRRGRPRKTA